MCDNDLLDLVCVFVDLCYFGVLEYLFDSRIFGIVDVIE